MLASILYDSYIQVFNDKDDGVRPTDDRMMPSFLNSLLDDNLWRENSLNILNWF